MTLPWEKKAEGNVGDWDFSDELYNESQHSAQLNPQCLDLDFTYSEETVIRNFTETQSSWKCKGPVHATLSKPWGQAGLPEARYTGLCLEGVLISPRMEIPPLPWPTLFQCHHHCAQANCIAASSHCLKLKSSVHENQQQLHVCRNCNGMWLVYIYWKSVYYFVSFQSKFLTTIWYWKFSPSSAAGSCCSFRITLACRQLTEI